MTTMTLTPMTYYLIGPSASKSAITDFVQVADRVGRSESSLLTWSCIHKWWEPAPVTGRKIGPYVDADMLRAAVDDLDALARADVVAVWADRHLRGSAGAHAEIGAALALNKPILWIEMRARKSRARYPDIFARMAKAVGRDDYVRGSLNPYSQGGFHFALSSVAGCPGMYGHSFSARDARRLLEGV